MDQSLLLSRSMKILFPTNLEFTVTLLVRLSEDMPSKSLVGELTTGSSSTHGTNPGETTDTSESHSESAESMKTQLLDMLDRKSVV